MKYLVTLADGRTLHVYAANEDQARKQAAHAETTRVIIAAKRGQPIGPDASIAFHIEKVKD